MPKFSYICRKPTGEKEVGVIEGASQDEVVAQLQRKGLFITSIIPFDVGHKEPGAPQEIRTVKKQFTHAGVNSHDLVLFARQLAMLLGAGVSLLRSLDVISKQVDSKKLAGIVGQVSLDMEAGRTLRDALSKFPDIFFFLVDQLIETGEASGQPPYGFGQARLLSGGVGHFKRKIISALLYPGILLFVSVSAVFFLFVKIVPTFATILVNFGVELPLPTKILIGLSTALTKNLLWIVIGVTGFVFLFRYIKRRPPFDRIIEDISLKVPIFGEFLRFMYLERFATTMSILIESGVPILYALEISERSAGSIRMTDAIGYIKRNVKEGRSMAVPMEKSEFFTPMVVQMIAIGEEIGELSNMLKRIAKYYQEYLEVFVSRLATIFEPLMIVFIGVIIGAMVISIFLPIFSIAFMKTA
jgi:type IV pilus assembly protein PilC